jgi:hypothetical protein
MPESAEKIRPETLSFNPAEVQNPMLRKAYEVWNVLKAARRFPTRAEIAPRNMAEFLRNTVLVRVLDGGKDFQFRIVGDAIAEVQGSSFRELTTTEIDARIPGYGAMLRSVYRQVCKTREPMAFRGWFVQPKTQLAFFHESLILPLGPDDATVDHILVVGVYAFEDKGLTR